MYNLLKISFLSFLFGFQLLNAQYGNGIIIANEGNFGAPNADVSYIDHQTMQITNNIYQMVNNEPLGDVLQNIGFYGDKAYLVLNNSNKIVVVNRSTFLKIGVITQNISGPRYIGFANDKLYVSNSVSNSVSVYNISDRSYVTSITNLGIIEEVEVVGDYVFVQKGSFSSGNKIAAINSLTDTLIGMIEIENGINGIASNGDFLYAISSGSNFTHLYKINPENQSIVSDLRTTEITSGGKIQVADDQLYFTGNGHYIYTISESLANDPSLLLTVPDNSWSTLYGFGVVNDFILTSDANGFSAASIIKVYNKATGSEIMQASAGIGANGFYDNFVDNLGVNETDFATLDVQLYPNPIKDVFYLKGVDKANIKVYTTLGKLVKSISYEGQPMFVGDLTPGIYFLNIFSEQGKISKKMIVK